MQFPLCLHVWHFLPMLQVADGARENFLASSFKLTCNTCLMCAQMCTYMFKSGSVFLSPKHVLLPCLYNDDMQNLFFSSSNTYLIIAFYHYSIGQRTRFSFHI